MTRFSTSRGIMYSTPPETAEETVETEAAVGHATADD
jgi:hypothetical protein